MCDKCVTSLSQQADRAAIRPIPTLAARTVRRTYVLLRESTLTSDERTTTQAVDLAERIVDAISEANQDWRAIELRARELVELVARRAAGTSSRLAAIGGS